MNRKIEFRAKTLAKGEWVYGVPTKSIYGDEYDEILVDAMSINATRSIDPATLGQYTGMKDSKGIEIYEGDIVEITSYFTHPRDKVLARTKAVVEFRNGAFVATHGSGVYHITNFLEDVEVVGNIHDNPKLLEQEGGQG